MKTNILICCTLFSITSIMVSCQQKTQNKEINTSVKQLKMKEQFPNNKTAFEKINDQVVFYQPSGNKVLTVDLKSSEYKFSFPDEVYAHYLVKVDDFKYFLPKKMNENYDFSESDKSTAQGSFNKIFNINELGLITSVVYEQPENGQVKKHTAEFTYNKYAQLLKIIDNGKTVLENNYDDHGNLIESKTSGKHVKYQYDAAGKVVKTEVEKNGVKNTFNYTYNPAGLVERKYTENQNEVEEFKYDSKGNIVEIIKYSGTIDKSDSKKLINHFIKNTYVYRDNHISEEKEYEYNIVNASVLVDKKWNPISVEEQRKLARKKLTDSSEMPLSETESKLTYQSGQINAVKSEYSFSNRVKNGKAEQNKEILNTENIKFTLDSSGRVTKKEVKDKNNRTKTQEFSY